MAQEKAKEDAKEAKAPEEKPTPYEQARQYEMDLRCGRARYAHLTFEQRCRFHALGQLLYKGTFKENGSPDKPGKQEDECDTRVTQWKEWKALGDMSKEEAKKVYVAELIEATKKAHKPFVPK